MLVWTKDENGEYENFITIPPPPFPIGSRVRPSTKWAEWMGNKTVLRWQPMKFADDSVKFVLWMKRDGDGVEHYYIHPENYFELIEEDNA